MYLAMVWYVLNQLLVWVHCARTWCVSVHVWRVFTVQMFTDTYTHMRVTCPIIERHTHTYTHSSAHTHPFTHTHLWKHASISAIPSKTGSAQYQQNKKRWTGSKWPENRQQQISAICKHVIGKTVEWVCIMEDGVPCSSFSAQILQKCLWYGWIILPKISILSCWVGVLYSTL